MRALHHEIAEWLSSEGKHVEQRVDFFLAGLAIGILIGVLF